MKADLVKNKIKKAKLSILIFTFFFLINILVSGGHFDPVDGVTNFLITESLITDGYFGLKGNLPSAYNLGLDIEKQVAFQLWDKALDSYYNEFGNHNPSPERTEWLWNYVEEEGDQGPNYLIVPTVAAPLYLLAKVIGVSPINFVAMLFNSTIVALISMVVFLISRCMYHSERIGFVLALIFGLTSFMWPYITTLYARPLAILFLFLSIYIILRQKDKKNIKMIGLAGIILGLSFLTHPLLLLAVPGVLIYGLYEFRKNKKGILLFLFGLIIIIGIQMYSNEIRFGSVTSFGYSTNDISNRSSEYMTSIFDSDVTKNGFVGFLFSPGQSIFIYLPIAILTPISLYYLYKKDKAFAFLLTYIIITTFLYLANSQHWNTNPYWGPHRYLLPIIPAIVLSIGSLIMEFKHTIRLKVGIILLSSIGFIVNLLGNLVWIQYAYAFGWSQEGLWKVIEKEREIFTWEPFFSSPIQAIKVLASNWVSTLTIDPTVLNYMKIGLYGCSYDLFIYCKFGIIPIIVLLITISIIAYVILRRLNSLKSNSQNISSNVI